MIPVKAGCSGIPVRGGNGRSHRRHEGGRVGQAERLDVRRLGSNGAPRAARNLRDDEAVRYSLGTRTVAEHRSLPPRGPESGLASVPLMPEPR